MDQPLQLDEYTGISLLHRASNARYYAASDAHGEPRLLVVFEQRRGLELEEQRAAFSLRARFESPQLDVLRGPATLGQLTGFLRSQPGVVYQESGGIPLAAWLERNPGPVPVEYALDFTLQLAEALAFAHGRGVLHRALSPSTVWVEDKPELRLRRVFGFGFANLLEAEQSWSRTGTMLGEVEWMAPEQFLGGELSPSTDLYTAGLLFYRLCTGTSAVEGASVYQLVQAHCDPHFTPPSAALGLSPQLLELLARAMQKEPRARYAQASEMLAALQAESQRVTRAFSVVAATRPQRFGEVTGSPLRGPDGELLPRPPSRVSPFAAQPSPAEAPAEQGFYAPSQATPERQWVHGNATSVDRDSVLKARDVDLAQRPHVAAPAQASESRRGSASPRSHAKTPVLKNTGAIVAILAVLTALALGSGAFWYFYEPSDDASVARRADERASTPAVVGLPDRRCSWDDSHATLDEGELIIVTAGAREIVVAYDGEIVEISGASAKGEPAIARVPAPNGSELYQRKFPGAGQDWVFVLPSVTDLDAPKLWSFQFQGSELKSQHQLPLATGELEEAALSLSHVDGECVLQLRVKERVDGKTYNYEMRLRMVDQGLVVESGALGRLYAPSR